MTRWPTLIANDWKMASIRAGTGLCGGAAAMAATTCAAVGLRITAKLKNGLLNASACVGL